MLPIFPANPSPRSESTLAAESSSSSSSIDSHGCSVRPCSRWCSFAPFRPSSEAQATPSRDGGASVGVHLEKDGNKQHEANAIDRQPRRWAFDVSPLGKRLSRGRTRPRRRPPPAGEGAVWSSGAYHMRFMLPDNCDKQKVTAELGDRVLLVVVPKTKTDRKVMNIEILWLPLALSAPMCLHRTAYFSLSNEDRHITPTKSIRYIRLNLDHDLGKVHCPDPSINEYGETRDAPVGTIRQIANLPLTRGAW
ncbi:hypothetical protein B296_00051149 [Ensete ventricosum]|uniref:SHSP domain-containing protein n=1 Tax=Ensete ventricosum TaxID=4639 RepID=A0A426YI07_ENSVE|nr:hypothetical protein B296_00051149 [Ensete ventricosum]